MLNGADVERLKRLLREKDAEARQLREHFDRELQTAIDLKEIEVRRQIVEEIQKRKENGESDESQVSVMIQKTLKVELDPKYLDATDALALALCHYYETSNPLAKIGGKADWKKFLEENPDRIKK